MALVVQKYGGTSVGNLDKIANVAKKVIRTKEEGNDVVVVLSAMSGETDRLIQLAQKAADEPDPREYDSLISTGEQVTVTLLAIMLNGMGYPAKSFLGFQVRVLTDQAFKKARILNVDTEAIRDELKKGSIVVVAGFQGSRSGKQHHHPGAGRIGHQRRGPGRCAQGRCLRHLYRR